MFDTMVTLIMEPKVDNLAINCSLLTVLDTVLSWSLVSRRVQPTRGCPDW
jgi:hypothetical protein